MKTKHPMPNLKIKLHPNNQAINLQSPLHKEPYSGRSDLSDTQGDVKFLPLKPKIESSPGHPLPIRVFVDLQPLTHEPTRDAFLERFFSNKHVKPLKPINKLHQKPIREKVAGQTSQGYNPLHVFQIPQTPF